MEQRLRQTADVATSLTELAALLLTVEDVEEALRHLARMAVVVIPDGPSCGITVVRDGKYTTAVYSGAIPASVHEAQYEYGEGPCLEAMRTREPVIAQDLAGERRWAGFTSAALSAGAHGVYAHPLQIGDEVLGALSLYAHERNMFPRAVQRVAEQFVEPAAVLLRGVLHRLSQAELIDQLRAGLLSRAVIDQAIGIVMAQRRCGPGEAIDVLRKLSNDRNVKLRHVAADLVSSLAGDSREAPRGPRGLAGGSPVRR